MAVPCSAELTYDVFTQFDDSSSTLGHFGEEVQVEFEIDPGESKVDDLIITINEMNGLIDDWSIDQTISPAGAGVEITRNGHIFHCDVLKPGEKLTLTFNAYPKSISNELIDLVNIKMQYVQLGQDLTKESTISADLSESYWFKYNNILNEIDSTKSDASQSTIILYISIVFFVLSVILLIYTRIGKGSGENKINEIRSEWREQLKYIHNKMDSICNNRADFDTLKRKIERDIDSIPVKEIRTKEKRNKKDHGGF